VRELKSLVDVFSDNSFDVIRGANIVLKWPKIVNKTIAKNSSALKFERGTLYVEVANSAWGNELNFLKENCLEKLNQHLGKKIIKDIKFIVAGAWQATPPDWGRYKQKGEGYGKSKR